jgi:uncharacterized protein YqkB
MVNWQVTATTVFCDAVDDEVTIIVYKDWSVKCTGHEKYANSRDAEFQLVKRSLQLRRTLQCEGLECERVNQYKEKLAAEETGKAGKNTPVEE